MYNCLIIILNKKKYTMNIYKIFFIGILCFFVNAILAQNSVTLNINHKLGDEDFAFNAQSTNDVSSTFMFTRVQYYLSGISIIHDGGQETELPDIYALVNANAQSQIPLGSLDIQMVEGLKFFVGVDPATNHLDPASYDTGHPLAPQWPSMHWNWNAGYRFLALEGKGGPALNQVFQLHGLGDQNYFETYIPVTATAVGGVLNVNLDADYSMSLKGINVDGGVIIHGDYGAARTSLQNMSSDVFTASPVSTSIDLDSSFGVFDVSPNPTKGDVQVAVNVTDNNKYEVAVYNLLGRELFQKTFQTNNENLQLWIDKPGIYILILTQGGSLIGSKKLVVQ